MQLSLCPLDVHPSSLRRRTRYLLGHQIGEPRMLTKTYVTKNMPSPGRPAAPWWPADAGLAAVLWENDDPKRVPLTIAGEDASHPVLRETERQLKEISPVRVPPSICRWISRAPNSRNLCGRRCWPSPLAKPAAMARSLRLSVIRAPAARVGAPMAGTRSRSSTPLPPGDRRGRPAHRLCRRVGSQGAASGAGSAA